MLAPEFEFRSSRGTTGTSPVTAWANGGTSGASLDLSNTVGSPTLETSGGPNGAPRIACTSAAREASSTRLSWTDAGFAAWIVCRVNSTTLQSGVFSNDRIVAFTDASGVWHLFNQGVADNTHASATAGGWQCVEIVATAGGGFVDLDFRVGGVTTTYLAQTYVAGGAVALGLGGTIAPAASNASADVDIAYGVGFGAKPSAGDIALIRAWLSATYGVTA